MLITFEGTEGSGKSDGVSWLARRLAEQQYRVLTTREPGGTALGERIRQLLLDGATPPSALASLLLFSAARAELVGTVIRPALAVGTIVISDRFTDSTLAYQGFGEGLDLEEARRLNNLATGGLVPDLTILLDIDPALGLARRRQGSQWDAMDARTLSFHRRVRDGFLTLASCDPARWLVLDASQPVETVRAEIARRIEEGPYLGSARVQETTMSDGRWLT